jgi:uncharacterized protein (TIGR00730 family)
MKQLSQIAVFCGAAKGLRQEYSDGAKQLAQAFVARQTTLVYGGGKAGLYGELANYVLDAGGKVIGIIPQFLVDKERAHRGLTELHIVESMHARKDLIAKLVDGFIMLPGGVGTLEEFCEIFTWVQLGLQNKPCGILNIGNYFDTFLNFLDHMVAENFLSSAHRSMILVENSAEKLLNAMASFTGAPQARWVDATSTV